MSTPMYTVTVMPLGARVSAASDTTLLRALEAAGLDLPSSCRNGTCRTCICRLLEGAVAYTVEWPGLSADEKQGGYVLPCVALAQDDVVLQIPLARRLRIDPA